MREGRGVIVGFYGIYMQNVHLLESCYVASAEGAAVGASPAGVSSLDKRPFMPGQ